MRPVGGWGKRARLTGAVRRDRGRCDAWFGLAARWRILALAVVLFALTAAGVALAWQTAITFTAPTNLYVNRASTVEIQARSASGERITGATLTFPPNTDVSAVTTASVTLTHGGASVTPTSVTVNAANRTVTVALSSARAGTNANRVFIARVTSVAHPSEPGSYTYQASLTSTVGTISGTSSAYTLAANTTAPSVGAVTLGSQYAGSASAYSFPVTVGPYGRLAATAAPGGTVTPNSITVEFPVGTILPASAAASSVTINGAPLTAAPAISGQQVTIRIPSGVTVANSGAANLVFTSAFGVRNPSAGPYTLRVRTSAETGFGTSVSYTVTPPPDATPPVVTLSVSPPEPDGLSGWHVTAPALTAATDETATVFSSFVSASGPWTLWADPAAPLFPPEGASTLHVYATDAANNASAALSRSFALDTRTPPAPAASAAADGASAIVVSWGAVADPAPGSGLSHYAVFDGAGSLLATTAATSWRHEGLAPGATGTYRLSAVDAAGRASAQSAPASATTPVPDATPPVVTLSVSPPEPDGLSGWHVTAPALTAATDETATVLYRFSETDEWAVWTDTTVPIPTSHIPEGESTFWYYARDLAQNVSPISSLPLKVDTFSPPVPALTANVSGTNAVELTWTPVTDPAPGSGLAHYAIYRLPENSIVATAPASATAYSVTGLTPNTLYEFYVRAVDVAGNRSAQSNAASATTEPDDVSASRTTLAVNPPVPDGHNGWYRTKPVTITLTPDPVIASTPFYAWGAEPATADGWHPYAAPLQALAEGISTLYYYARPAEAFRLVEPVRFETIKIDTAAPPLVADIAWIQQGVDGALLSWAPVAEAPAGSGLAFYEVLVDGVVRHSPTLESALLPGLAPEVDYVVSVRAVDNAGNRSDPSAPAIVRLETIIVPPEPPRRVVARAIEGAQVFVAWDPSPTLVTAPVVYHVYRTADGVTYDHVGTVAGVLNRSFVDSSVSPRSSYHYAVSVETSGAAGPLSSTSAADAPHAAVALTSAPPIPRNVTAQVQPSGSVVLEWSSVQRPEVTGYNVYRATASGTEPVLIGTAVEPGLYAFTDAETAPCAQYWYSVAAVDDQGRAGPRSTEVRVRARVDTPAGMVVPHASFTEPESRRCQLCHTVADARSPETLLATSSSRALCETCHDGTGASTAITDDLDPSGRLHSDTGGTLACIDCHTPHSGGEVAQMGVLLRSESVSAGNAYCYTCHGTDAVPPLGNMRQFEGSVHATVPAGAAGITCLNCHEAHASTQPALGRYAYPGACLRCHGDSAVAPGGFDILTRATQSVETSAGHDILGPGGSMTCRTCHSPHSASAAYPLVDPSVPGGTEPWRDGTTEFCLTCHSATPPAEFQSASDVSATWVASIHGPGVDGGGPARFLRADMGFSAGETLSCAACHEPHRSPNVGNLRGDVRSKDGASVQTGLLAVDVPGGGSDVRYFCRACHDLPDAAHPDIPGEQLPGITAFPLDCTRCHNHEAGL